MPDLAVAVAHGATVAAEIVDILFEEFEQHLVHGGYLTAIHDLARFGELRAATDPVFVQPALLTVSVCQCKFLN